MSEAPTWRAAQEAAVQLAGRPGDRRTVLLLTRLPLVSERVIRRLAGARGGASVYRSLARLRRAGLIAAIRPSLGPGPAPRLWHLMDLGLAVAALDQGVEPAELARRNRLRGGDLRALLPGRAHLLAAYELLGALAASRPGRPDLLAWERPWRRRFVRPTTKAPTTVRLPASAALAWGDRTGAYLLLPDLATCPLRAYQGAIDRLLRYRTCRHGELPPFLVATTDDGRVGAWEGLLEEARRARAEAELDAIVTTWDRLRSDPTSLVDGIGDGLFPAERLIRRVRVPRLKPRRPGSLLPRLVGDVRSGSTPPADGDLGRQALALASADRALLDLVGRHPFLPLESLAAALGWSVRQTQERRGRLLRLGLLRVLGSDEQVRSTAGHRMEHPKPMPKRQLVELTRAGLTIAAAQQGLSLAAAVRFNGLTGAGPGEGIGARRQLVGRHLEHTLGTADIFLSLIRTARAFVALGSDDALVDWQSAAACGHGHVRPDGYGVYRHRGRLYGFFLEYDRGTMSTHAYVQKFAAYAAYRACRHFERTYTGFPTILVVTADDATEQRLARAARAAAVGQPPALPVLLTCRWRIDDESNPPGLLGPIWREPEAGFQERRFWPDGRPPPEFRPTARERWSAAPIVCWPVPIPHQQIGRGTGRG